MKSSEAANIILKAYYKLWDRGESKKSELMLELRKVRILLEEGQIDNSEDLEFHNKMKNKYPISATELLKLTKGE